MKYSQLFGKTKHGERSGSDFISHQLLLKGGFIEESTAGRYFFLPLGWRVHEKIKKIIKEEMDAAGGQEMISPVLHPLELWEETNRTNSVGFELMSIEDRRGAKFALGGTAEEMFVDVVRKFNLTYKDLPFNIYQFSTKFRDEMRARGGLLRVREFVMKDAYSFHTNEKDFKKEYQIMAKAYAKIFSRLGLKTLQVEADNGYIGGEYCHEFQVESPIGEGRFFVATDKSYSAHEDVAVFYKENKNIKEKMKPYKEVKAERGNTMEDGAKLHQLPLWQQIKDVLYVNEKNEFILAIIRGDFDVNETKLLHLSGSYQLRPATEEEIRKLGSEPGFISPVGLKSKVKIVVDDSLHTIRNAYGGANKKHLDAININIDRDYQADVEGDIAMAQEGFLTGKTRSPLQEKRGIEVGNIFQLGYHYSKRMKNATFIDKDGKAKPFYMGCYGIGLGRTLATIVEKYHDDRGIVWPAKIAPFQIHLISLQGATDQAKQLYEKLNKANIEVLWDDRDESPGKKFAVADLVGIPIRLVVSTRTGNEVEWKNRASDKTELLTITQVMKKLSV
ncbi:MAG: proline--tRNA ligase [Candidatus Pacebacteria bacterium RIFOXYB1_FULL_39_46]|nr:MAG: proline--tRNA ligase [Candidatus Pacebacteria bacterium RIFOXYB1_FULL_39_46]OGJ38600.1 MAG: proline--tRNA ligase [Candidatus Pacebacteria bacterium RIFOXYA1_FULL_38_18]OGJ40931.1 MAG: proline--tRNA ligase [Candidatus Pacebacteria bacterium RIFOXYC1_FULL_39_21]